jgi:hypothetical protein
MIVYAAPTLENNMLSVAFADGRDVMYPSLMKRECVSFGEKETRHV